MKGGRLPGREAGALVRLALIVVCLLQETAHAQEHEEAHASTAGHESVHTVGVFIGDTREDRRDGFTLGLEYEYRTGVRYGFGFTAEHVAGPIDADVFVLPVGLHEGPWKLYAGPGVELGEDGSEPLLRLGVEYGFHIGDYEVSPQLDVDFVNGENVFVFGVVFATEF